MRITLRVALGATATTLTLATAAACGSGASGISDTSKPIAFDGETIATPALLKECKDEGASVMFYSSAPADTYAKVIEDIKADTGITVTQLRATSSEVYSKIVAEAGGGKVDADVVALNDPSLRKSLKDKGIVEDFTIPNEKQVDDGKTLDIAYAKPSDVASQVIVWNTSMVKDADAPKSYADLLDPQWKGKFGMTAIQTGLSSITVAKSIWDGLGPEKMKQFGAAQPKIYTSVVPLTQAVVRGEIPVAITDLSITQGYIDDGSPLAWAAPTEGTPTWSSAQMIPKSSEHQACAKIFVAWSASMRGADAVWKDTKFLSYRTIDDRPSDAPDIGTPYFVDTKWLLKNRDAFVKQWSSVVAQGQ
jgi:iron(III) transport system substrate-binding protein